jgi:hypothetical protein
VLVDVVLDIDGDSDSELVLEDVGVDPGDES